MGFKNLIILFQYFNKLTIGVNHNIPYMRNVMLKKETYENIKQKHGIYASWAVWANEKNENSPPKENIDDLSIFDLNINPQLLDYLNPEIIMCGLSWGGDAGVLNAEQVKNYPKLSNFHNKDKIDPVSKKRNTCLDFKLRYAFRNTDFYGAYMTDIISSQNFLAM